MAAQGLMGATVQETEGSTQNLNQANLRNALASHQAQVKTYVETTKPDATAGDVLGTKTIIPQNYAVLPGTLPYLIVTTGSKIHALPDQVRHKFQYNVYASALDRALDSPALSFQQSLPKLAGKKITLSFRPASQADTDLIESYTPKPHADGSPILPSEYPKNLPGYLIKLVAELRVDGQIVALGGTYTMGTELVSSMGLFEPNSGWQFGEDNKPVVGEFVATYVDLQGVSQAQIEGIKTKLAATKLKLETRQFSDLTKEDIAGDMLHSAILHWFATNRGSGRISAQAASAVEYPKPSFGSFMAAAQTSYWFGVPRTVAFSGLVMDVDWYSTVVAAKDNGSTIEYVQQSGMRLSAFEHLIPEQMFTNAQTPGEGVSAVKALAAANAQGQKIFRIGSQNVHAILPQLAISQDVKAEIQNAVAAGKRATVSQANVTIGGWTGVGYILDDPTTGAGAYKISGGANGGVLEWIGENSTAIGYGLFVVGLLAAIPGLFSPLLVFLIVLITIVVTMLIILAALNDALNYADSPKSAECVRNLGAMFAAIAIATLLLGLFFGGPAALALGFLGFGVLSDDFFKAVVPVCSKI